MKRLMLAMVLAAVAGVAGADDKKLSLVDARGQISAVAANPSKAGAIFKQLSAADQKSYLAELNGAIASMPGEPEQRLKVFLEVNEAAMKNAQSGNLPVLLAECFATVTPEALTVINERFAADLFARDADPTKKFSDAQFTAIATNRLAEINARNESADRTAVRDTFAILMFLRASGGSPADLADTLVKGLPEQVQELAQKEWIPPAMSEAKDYGPLLGAADVDEMPFSDIRLYIPNNQHMVAMLGDLAQMSKDNLDKPIYDTVIGAGQEPLIGDDMELNRVPRTLNPAAPWNPEYRRGEKPEPGPYDGMEL